MSSTTIKQILGIQITRITGKQLGKLIEERKGPNNAFKLLPQFVLDHHGLIKEAKYWLQYVHDGDEQFILFDNVYADSYLSEEISNTGLDDILKKHNMLPLFTKLEYVDFDSRSLPVTSRLVLEVTYSSYSNGESTEYDSEVELSGYMDAELNIHGPIFTTFDKVGIFVPEHHIFAVITDGHDIKIDTGKWDTHGALVAIQEKQDHIYKWFSSKKARQEFMDGIQEMRK